MYLKIAVFLFGIMLFFLPVNILASGEKDNMEKDILIERKQTDNKILLGEPSEFSAFWSRYLRLGESVALGVDAKGKLLIDEQIKKGIIREPLNVEYKDGFAWISKQKAEWGKHIKLGDITFVLTEQSGMARIIAYDPKQPKRLGFKGLKYFPPDLTYRFVVPLNKLPNPKMIKLQSSRGLEKEYLEYGTVNFTLEGKENRLFVYVPFNNSLNPTEYFVPFRDATSGKESYKLARYVDLVPVQNKADLFILDFNKAYNPSCSYTSEHFNCPIPPKNNTLIVPIRAGEKRY